MCKMKWFASIGFEIHLQLAASKKLFSGAKRGVSETPNTSIAHFDVSLPGSMPILSQEALRLAVRGALALNCNVAPVCQFDRKHYFYPDLPAGYQITQRDVPLGRNGFVQLSKHLDDVDNTIVPIQHVQLEQDTAKSIHVDSVSKTLLDFNRAGSPLLEVVTAPCLHDENTAGSFLRKIQSIMRYARVSDAKMETGGMRCDVNVSIAPIISTPSESSKDFTVGLELPKTELKNLSSVRNVMNAIRYEVHRQISLAEKNEIWATETRGFDDKTGQTFLLRDKSISEDYLYLPETDVPPVTISKDYVREIANSMGPLPDDLFIMLTSKPYSMSIRDARILLNLPYGYDYYYTVRKIIGKQAGFSKEIIDDSLHALPTWIITDLVGKLHEHEKEEDLFYVPPNQLADIVCYCSARKISRLTAKALINHLIVTPSKMSVADIIKELKLDFIQDSNTLDVQVGKILEASPKQVREFLNGKQSLLKYFIGQVMRQVRGRGDPVEIEKLLKQRLGDTLKK
ncbi:glutamyl-tRNA amidotransferase beta subunit [Schizosaccharomyces cryophilus OY26]|uniref:Glutamyl-tRNA(Gln) amidotransferase subunit B, mitochondrial n=1 Tax=Schizosaccharomyces cryophilus (strain OY26 / ATCC MYA-4695 / CBS 11777 / NBRC 106824 / NRRL Y48691) TaxID=653667 RepID=S9X7E9_SCHCR|nr:glutamyl-tRNA amidotransferase beta subunit [Schizosaccharomyces cryophilus OY26]EPY49701.1 glutamyl-tRNA amidotransferase beta subunit [Schizosaccharomyces cryophilus OY26]